MQNKESIAKRLKLAREAKFATAEEAAASMDMRYQTYAAHENGNRSAKNKYADYARKFGVSVDWLVTGKGKGPSEGDDDDPWEAIQADFDRLSPKDQRTVGKIIKGLLEEDESKSA